MAGIFGTQEDAPTTGIFAQQPPNLQQPTGIMGALMSPVGQGLLAAGLGALASRGTRAQAIGRGGLMGLSTFGQAQQGADAQQQRAWQLNQQQQALAQLVPNEKGVIDAPISTYAAAGIDTKYIPILRDMGRDKFKQMQTVTNPDGTQSLHAVNEYGGISNTGLTNAAEIKTQDLGGKVAGINPYTGQQAWDHGKTQTFGELESARHNRASEGLTLRGQNLVDARSREANQTGRAPAGYRWSADGVSLEPIPGGPAIKDKVPTEFQSKSAGFGARSEESDRILRELEAKGVTHKGFLRSVGEGVPFVGESVGSIFNAIPGVFGGSNADQQRVVQAQRDFVNAVLRQESGAAIAESEFQNASKQYFGQVGDTPEVLAQKARNRQLAIESFKKNAGGAWSGSPPASAPSQSNQVDALLQKYR
jgi:hypothetical protein